MAAAPRESARDNGDPALVLPVYTRLSDAEEAERKRLGLGESGFVKESGVAEELAGIHLRTWFDLAIQWLKERH